MVPAILSTGFVASLFVLTAAFPRSEPSKCSQELVDGFNQFALELHKDISRDDPNGNIFFSPYSIASCFLMVLLGSAGDTSDSIADVFHITPAIRESVQAYQKCIEKAVNGRKAVTLSTANRVYPSDTLHLYGSYVNAIKNYYGKNAKIEPLDFKKTEESRQYINDWIANVTNNKLTDVIQPDNIDAMTVIVLVNAIYFKGAWKYRFHEEMTHKAQFFSEKDGTVEVDMMVNETYFRYTNSPQSLLNAQIVELPYVGDSVSMIIMLPNEKFGLKKLEEKLTLDKLKDELKYLYPDREVTVSLPKFKIKERYILNNNLKRMGMDHVFDGADLSNMASDDRLSIDEVIHEAFVEINEEGTEAAAVTVIAGGRSGPPPPARVTCDHPFLFFIRDNPTGAILFWGRYTTPEPAKKDKKGGDKNRKTTPRKSKREFGDTYKQCERRCLKQKADSDGAEEKCERICTKMFPTTLPQDEP